MTAQRQGAIDCGEHKYEEPEGVLMYPPAPQLTAR